jgi:hypothetical protein
MLMRSLCKQGQLNYQRIKQYHEFFQSKNIVLKYRGHKKEIKLLIQN